MPSCTPDDSRPARIQKDVVLLENPQAQFVSLVKHAATRIPFRVIKEEKPPMFDLDVLRRNIRGVVNKSEAAPAPRILALVVPEVVSKGDHKTTMIAHGFMVSKAHTEADGSVVYKQEDTLPDEYSIFRVSDNLLALVSGFDAEAAVAGSPVEGVFKSEGWYPSAELAIQIGAAAAQEVVEDGTLDTIRKSERVDQVSKGINSYLSKLFAWVPSRLTELARDLEAQISATVAMGATDAALRGVPAAQPKTTETDIDTGSVAGVNATGTPSASPFNTLIDTGTRVAAPAQVAKADASNPDGTGAVAAPQGTSDDLVAAALATVVSKMEDLFTQTVSQQAVAIAQLSDTVAALGSELEAVKKSHEILADRSNEASRIAKSVETRVSRTVLMGADGEQPPASTVVKHDSGELGQIDTAFGRSARRTARNG